MGIFGLAFRNIRGNRFRSIAIFLCVLGVSAFLLSTTLIIKGAQYSLNAGITRLGADIIVVPAGAENKLETALLMGKPTTIWMPEEKMQEIAAIPGVDKVSPQIYLSSLYGASCCSVSEMFMVVYDPASDFTITPWLQRKLGRNLQKGEVIGGTYIFVPEGQKDIKLYGYGLTLKGNLEPTGTGIDQTLFMALDTAKEMAKSSETTAITPLQIPENEISAVMVKVKPGEDIHKVALTILKDTLGMFPIESPNLFGTFRNQMNGLLWGFFAITIIVWALALLLMGLIFSMAANERRREIAVLKALGATRNFIFSSVLTEAALLSVAGATIGIILSGFGLFIGKDYIAGSLKMPFLFPSFVSFLGFFGGGIALALLTVTLAAFYPAFLISRQEAAIAMRE